MEHQGSPNVDVGIDARLSFQDVAPFLDELNEQYDRVQVHRWNIQPPAADGAEIVIAIAISGHLGGCS